MTLAEVIDLDHRIHTTRTKPLWRQGRIFLHFRWPINTWLPLATHIVTVNKKLQEPGLHLG